MTATQTSPRLDTLRTMAEIARMAQWSTRRVRRHLLRLHQRNGETLLVRHGEREWMVTLANLRRVWPEFGKQVASNDDVREVLAEQTALRRDIKNVAVALRDFKAKSHAWFQRLEAVERKLAEGHGEPAKASE